MKMIEGFLSSANWNSIFIVFSLSPCHLDSRSELDKQKNVLFSADVAAALARCDFPVPGGLKAMLMNCFYYFVFQIMTFVSYIVYKLCIIYTTFGLMYHT